MSTPNDQSSRRVSFASEVHSRRYNQDDTVIFDSGSVPDINDEVEPLYDLAAMNTPRRSPFSARRSRPDIFGSPSKPPVHRTNGTPLVVESIYDLSPLRPQPNSPLSRPSHHPTRRSPFNSRLASSPLGSPHVHKRLISEDHEEEDGSDSLMAYLSRPVKRRNIFDEDDEDNNTNTDATADHDNEDINPTAANNEDVENTPTQTNAEANSGIAVPIIITNNDAPTLTAGQEDEERHRLDQNFKQLQEYDEEEEDMSMVITGTYQPVRASPYNTPAAPIENHGSPTPSEPIAKVNTPSNVTNMDRDRLTPALAESTVSPSRPQSTVNAHNDKNEHEDRLAAAMEDYEDEDEEIDMVITDTYNRPPAPVDKNTPPEPTSNADKEYEDRLEAAIRDYEEDEEIDMAITETYNPRPTPTNAPKSPASSSGFVSPVKPNINRSEIDRVLSPSMPTIPSNIDLWSPARNIIQSPLTTFSPNRTFFLKEREKPKDHISEEDLKRSTNHITLSEFLDYVSTIKLEKEKPIEPVDEDAFDDINKDDATVAQKIVAHDFILPQYELYHLASNKLKDLTEDCKENVKTLRDQIDTHNPKLFQEYIDGTISQRRDIEALLEKSQKVSKLEASRSWYEWWAPRLHEFAQEAKDKKSKYQKSHDALTTYQETLNTKIPELKDQLAQLEAWIVDTRKTKQDDAEDRRTLENLRAEIEQQRAVIDETRAQTESLQNRLDEMEVKKAALEKQNQELDETIKAQEETLARDNTISDEDMAARRKLYLTAYNIFKTRVNTPKQNTINFMLAGQIDVTIDKDKLDAKDSEAILIRMPEKTEKELGPFAELVHGLSKFVVGIWKVEEITQLMAIYWNRLNFVRQEITDLQRRYFTTLTAVPNTGVSIKSVILNSNIVQFVLSFDITADTVMQYPRLRTYDVKFKYAKRGNEDLQKLVENCLLGNGMESLHKQMNYVATKMAEEQ